MDTVTRTYNGRAVPEGETIRFENGKPVTPTRPIIPFIEGDGIGPEIFAEARRVVERAVFLNSKGKREIVFFEVFGGGKAQKLFGTPLPEDTLKAVAEFRVAIKGPMATPSGGGMRSLNVTLRQHFDLYQCVRPVRWFRGVPTTVTNPEALDVVIFRQNTEGYGGAEFFSGEEETKDFVNYLRAKRPHMTFKDTSGFTVKAMTPEESKRLVRKAIEFAIKNKRKVVTLVGKGNIDKATDGLFVNSGFEVAKAEFRDFIVTEDEKWNVYGGKVPEGKILVNYRITDAMFAEIILRPGLYDVIATTNQAGDFLSDAAADRTGGLGNAPGTNIGDDCFWAEATHGTADDIAGKGIANPMSLIGSFGMLLDYIGWADDARMIETAVRNVIIDKKMTGDMARLVKGAKALSTKEFADAVIAELGMPAREPRRSIRGTWAGLLRRIADRIDD